MTRGRIPGLVVLLVGIVMLVVTSVALDVRVISAINETRSIISTNHSAAVQRDAVEIALEKEIAARLAKLDAEFAELKQGH